jgi:cysteine peptidase C11 family protein
MSVAYKQALEATTASELTIMIFFAGDPHLSPSMTSQLKAIKDAGFQQDTNVLVHFDPNEKGAGVCTFEINRERKREKATVIGDGRDPFVRNLIEDCIDGTPKSATAVQALQTFLDIGIRDFRAKHYMLFLVGHGDIVGNDAFLPDDSPNTAITLRQLGAVLSDFSRGVQIRGGVVDLIGLHSCSMSAIEVAYELKGAARYMMATEGMSFVSSWPYRQLLKKVLNTVDKTREDKTRLDIDQLIFSIQKLSLHNSTDFMFSGVSADLTLMSLDEQRIDELNAPLKTLVSALKKGLDTTRGMEAILLAHLKSQSFWQENYTDLYDFCLCLERQADKCDPVGTALIDACKGVRSKLEESNGHGFIIQSDFFGPLYQYSHGVSVYFPWARPVQEDPPNEADDILLRYKNYQFTKALGDDSWISFLDVYFKKTQRQSRETEDTAKDTQAIVASNGKVSSTSIEVAVFANANVADGESLEPPEKSSPSLQKNSPPLGAAGCSCSPKNFPMKFTKSPRAKLDANTEVTGTPARALPSGGIVATR